MSPSTDSKSIYNLKQEPKTNKLLNIGWNNLTLTTKKFFGSDVKLILRDINGFIEYRTLTALMGPSGAGKSSLLKTLNGMNRNLMTKESKILCHKDMTISSCFVAQDQREHINDGLTVRQSLTYTSKLKNIGQHLEHSLAVNALINDFDLK